MSSSAWAFQDDEDDLLDALGDLAMFVETEVFVAGATRRVAKLSEAPGTIAVLDGETLRERGVLTIEEAIRYVNSIYFAPGTIAVTTRIRDIEQTFANKVLILQDGRSLNSVFRGNAYVNLSQPIENIARIEVVRGPGSALYGANAFAGFINLITRRGDQIEGVEVSLDGGNNGLAHVGVVTGRKRGPHNWTVEARLATAAGQDPVNPLSENAEHDDCHVAFHWGKGDSKGETWFTNVSFTRVKAGVPGGFDFPTPGDKLEESRLSLDYFRLWEPSKKTKLKLRAYYNQQSNQYSFQRADVNYTPISDGLIGTLLGLFYDTSRTRIFPLTPSSEEPDDPGQCPVCDHVLIYHPAGESADLFDQIVSSGSLPQTVDVQDSDEWLGFVELQADWQVTKSNYLLGGASVRFDDLDNAQVAQRRFRNYAAFIEDEQRFLNDELILLGSLRLDDHSYFGLTLSPRVSLIWSPNDKLVMKSAYGKAFRSPNFVELFGETRIGTAQIFGQQRAVEQDKIPESFTRRICLSDDCLDFVDETVETELEQEEIETLELWTEYSPIKRVKLILNLYQYTIQNEVGVALDRNDIYFLADPDASRQLGGFRIESAWALPGFENLPTFGVFLNSPDETSGYGAELEVHAEPWDWLQIDWNYSRRVNEQARIGDFVEADDTSATPRLVPTFTMRRFHVDQSAGEFTFRPRDDFWASLRLRLFGRPDDNLFGSGRAFTSDLTVGYRRKNFTLAATVLNVNEGGALFDDSRDAFVETERDVRLRFGYRHEF